MEDNRENKSGNKAVAILLGVLLLGSLAGNFYLYKARDNKEMVINDKEVVIDSLVEARVSIESELEATRLELESYRGKSAELDSLLNDANRKLTEKENQIKRLVKDRKSADKLIAELKKEREELAKLREEYENRIDDLVAENENLKNTVNVVTITRDSALGKLTEAGALRVEYVTVKTYKVRGSGKQVETGLARRAEKMEVCFAIMDNKFAQAGTHEVHWRVLQPNGGVLGEKGKFMVKDQGIESGYTAMETFEYDKNRKDICLNFMDEKYKFEKGTYVVELFVDGVLHTSGFYELK